MTKAITYTLRLLEPCLLTAPGGDPNTERSFDYIPGGAMRGALAAAYLRANGEDASFAKLFLSGQVRFLNAYPDLNGRSLPPPRAWATKKDEDKTIYNRLDEEARAEVEAALPQGYKKPFIHTALSDGGETLVYAPDIATEIAIHTARNRQKGRAIEGDADSALFRYRALARDQRFAGAIVLDDEVSTDEKARLVALLDDATLLLGGSHTAGYGLVQAEDVKQDDAWRETDGPPPSVAAGTSFVVYLTSPAILYDPTTGQPTSDIRPFLPGGPDGYIIEDRDSYAATGWVGGFNKHRGLPLPQQWAVQMGSTWRIKTQRPLSAQDLANLEHSGIGCRTDEGFGRLVFGPHWPDRLAKSDDPPPPGSAARRPGASTGSLNGDALLARMNERIARRELDRLLAVAVNTKAGKQVRGHLSHSQFGRLMVRIRREADTKDFQRFIDYLEGTKKRKSADDQFRKYTVDGENFRDFLKKLAEKPGTVWGKIGAEDHQMPRIGPDGFDFQSELAHSYTVRYISDLCRQLAKREVGQ